MVIIIDGNHLFARCYFGVKPLMTSSGQETQGIYGFLNSLRSFIRQFKSEENHIFVAWDGGNQARRDIYPQYKENRKGFQPSYHQQIQITQTIVGHLRMVRQYKIDDVEGDDIIGTLTAKSRKKGQKVIIISADHDFQQLISTHVVLLKIVRSTMHEYIDAKWLMEEFSLRPNQVIDFLSLTGDNKDNIPGVPGVGNKTASKLISQNGSVEAMLADIDNIKGATDKIKEKIRKNVNIIRLARRLVTINQNIDLFFSLENEKENDFEALEKAFEKLEFKSFLKDINQWKVDFKE